MPARIAKACLLESPLLPGGDNLVMCIRNSGQQTKIALTNTQGGTDNGWFADKEWKDFTLKLGLEVGDVCLFTHCGTVDFDLTITKKLMSVPSSPGKPPAQTAGKKRRRETASKKSVHMPYDSDEDDVPFCDHTGLKVKVAKICEQKVTENRTKVGKSNDRGLGADHLIDLGLGNTEGNRAWWDEDSDEDENEGKKWSTLEHKGVVSCRRRFLLPVVRVPLSGRACPVSQMFPPAYVPHGKKLLYGPSKEPIELNSEAEEVVSAHDILCCGHRMLYVSAAVRLPSTQK